MIDIHCHLLPAVDDGPRNLDDALTLARACVVDGIQHAVLTPHVFPGRYANTRSTIAAASEAFRRQLADAQVPLSVSFAGEVRLMPEVLDLLARDELPFLGCSDGRRNLLLELPDGQIPLGAERFMHHLLRAGVRPVIAHPERNKVVMDQPQRMQPFVDAGCLLQLTAGSLLGHFGARAQGVSRLLLDAGQVAVLASDSHDPLRRVPQLRAARGWLRHHLGDAVAFELLAAGPARLCGLPTPAPWLHEVADDAGG